MAKRSMDSSSPVLATAGERQVPRRTERSHEENQERAYIAASRRADRSLEARVQSARMASEIHKKRTGKGFKITEEIVMKEEMYEEEEDELPRHYRALAAHLQTSSADMNSRLNAYVTNQVAIASLAARQQEIDRLFEEQFPNVARIAQSRQSISLAHSPHHIPQLHSYHLGAPPYPRDRTHSIPDVTPVSPLSSYQPLSFHGYNDPSTRHTSISDQMSPGGSPIPGSVPSRTDSTPITNYSGHDRAAKRHTSGIPVDPSLTMSTLPVESAGTSSFTSELPHETKLLVGDLDLVSAMYGGELMGSDQYYSEPPPHHYSMSFSLEPTFSQQVSPHEMPTFDYSDNSAHTAAHLGQTTQQSGTGTPNAGLDWDQWINSDDSLPHNINLNR